VELSGGLDQESVPWRPSGRQLQEARGRSIPDVMAPGLQVLFCGINPSLYSAAVGHHFARPGNRFWRTLQESGFTDRLLSPFEDARLLDYGLGCTNLVERATARADELTPAELAQGGARLAERVAANHPAWLAVLGVGAYRAAFGAPRAATGEQPARIAGARVWVLPNPSGLNAHYQLPDLAEEYRALRLALGEASSDERSR
jgi:TDG/mug DNA glycosylase family protein